MQKSLKYTHMLIHHVILGEVVLVSPYIHLLVFTRLAILIIDAQTR